MSKPIGKAEFIALMALLAALDALSIDSMIPALGLIGQDLGATGNAPQLVVSVFFGGMAAGQLFAGPMSDSLGRKLTIYIFIGLFMAGSLLAALAPSFDAMLLGRILQGLGAAGPFVVTIAIVRDVYSGNAMAQVMSFVLSVFILVPIVAPLMGQGILLVFDWRAIFAALFFFSVIVVVWFGLRQPETLAQEKRKRFSLGKIGDALVRTFKSRQTMTYTIVYGLTFGAFVGYLSSAQQVFQDIYKLGVLFPVIFASLSLGIGAAAIINGNLVMRLGMRRLCAFALAGLVLCSTLFLIWSIPYDGTPPFWSLIVYFVICMFCCGLLFGNISGLALEHAGDHAGMAATVFGSVSMVIALITGTIIGQSFDMTIQPLAIGFAVSPVLALLLMWREEKARPKDNPA